ncbi:hypothetical protein KEJ39_05440, partial [Candidatus Bathyarchaeota archaeon]|nr:hypothetical protein [Candidatus Bathyarchaeota archaeon]
VRKVMEDCYRRLSPQDPLIVDVVLFEDTSRMEAYLLIEQDSAGAYPQGFEAGFIATHDAWTGIPRILVCYERLRELSPRLRMAVLRHEVAHSVLHGSPEYYIYPVPQPLLEASAKYRLSRDHILHILYLVAIGVKDYEATEILLDHGYVEDQTEYAWYFCRTGEDDIQAWRIAEGDSGKEVLCLAGRFKDLACVAAVTAHQGSCIAGLTAAKKELEYLPEEAGSRLLMVCASLAEMDRLDTLSKIEAAAGEFSRGLIQPAFEARRSGNMSRGVEARFSLG